uniref:Zinc-binding protein A33-like n=1 Tax=Mastacembelus armatus TaxID=205130 RepID=A0A7N8XNL7_9TELE
MIMSLPEEDLTCPVCCDIFMDPVLLKCSHSFCRSCLKCCWDTGLRQCPVCRKRASKSSPPSNLALKNVCEALMQDRRQSSGLAEEMMNCNLHGEKLKLFCLLDKQPICVVCQSSKLHKTHDCSPIEEARLDCKNQALETQRLIKRQFEQLHQVLYQEESARLAAVKKEEEEKFAAMKDKIKEFSAEVLSLTEAISVIQQQLKEDDMILLKNFKDTQNRCKSINLESVNMSGLLINVSEHLCNLKHRVWEKMLNHIDFTPVILDPNTAHPCLILSDDLASLHYLKQPGCCPDNPERFHLSAEVVAMTALGSGSHQWVVETGSNQDWLLGVASSSVSRSAEISARPENGFWTLCFREGEFRAMTSPPTLLTLSRTPKKVKVQLDYNKGTVSFFDPSDNTLIYAFIHTFTETLLPYFYTQSTHPLRIIPEKVLVTISQQ